MNDLLSYLQDELRPNADLKPDALAEKLRSLASRWSAPKDKNPIAHLYPRSIQSTVDAFWFMVRCENVRWLLILGKHQVLSRFKGEMVSLNTEQNLALLPLMEKNAESLRSCFKWLIPKPYGLEPTFGCGDRLGLATPGHIRAARTCGVNVLLAQQSIREMARTGRTPRQVMDDATWGVFQEGYTEGFGSDADHLKTFKDIENTAAVGFTMFTIDPSEYVDRAADNASETQLDDKLRAINTSELPVPVPGLMGIYSTRYFDIPSLDRMVVTPFEAKRAIVKYGRAIAHTERMAKHVAKVLGNRPYDLEMSVDETDNPTTPFEHLFVGLELKRRKITVHSLALRFIGEFQKAIDYIGDLKEFEKSFAIQFAIAKFCGPYKMSIHSGSDKFSIFPIIGTIAGNLVHEKTAGTSYLEALRAVARVEPKLFREICHFALERYDTDKATYHVAEKLTQLPDIEKLKDEELGKLFEIDHGRQLLHVTFGSVLNEKISSGDLRFKNRIFEILKANEELYADLLETHFSKHMRSLKMATR